MNEIKVKHVKTNNDSVIEFQERILKGLDSNDQVNTSQPNPILHTTHFVMTLADLSTKIPDSFTPEAICHEMGAYGAIASLRIHSKFFRIAYMSQADALKAFQHSNLLQYTLIPSWDKPIHIPKEPLYIAPSFSEANTIKIVIPKDPVLLEKVDALAEEIVENGDEYETQVMTNESKNHIYFFLFDQVSMQTLLIR